MKQYWIEQELQISDMNWESVWLVDWLSGYEFVRQKIIDEKKTELLDAISPEELSQSIEIKSKPSENYEQATDFIVDTKKIIEQINWIKDRIQLLAIPLTINDFQPIPWEQTVWSSQRQLFDDIYAWYPKEEADRIVKWFAIFSTQVNISGLFEWLDEDITNPHFQELARLYLNKIHDMENVLTRENWKIVNWEGKTRTDKYVEVISKLKADRFDKWESIVFPPYFNSTEEMLTWIWKHWKKEENAEFDIWKLTEKDMHSFLAKLKWITYKWLELRSFDSTDDFESVWEVTDKVVDELDNIRYEYLDREWIRLAA